MSGTFDFVNLIRAAGTFVKSVCESGSPAEVSAIGPKDQNHIIESKKTGKY
jgi:uracil phosphoribosyltransferase